MSEDSEKEEVVELINIEAQDLVDELKLGAETYSTITESFIKEFVFYDKTLYQWATDLVIQIPSTKDLDLPKFRELLTKLGNNIQIASNYYSLASSMVDAISGGNNIKKSDLVNIIVSNYAAKGAKRPAGTVIERMADSYLSNTVSAEKAAKIVKNFWKQRFDTLLELRKVFEQIGLSLSVEMKFTSN
jgi:hypothetical protein